MAHNGKLTSVVSSLVNNNNGNQVSPRLSSFYYAEIGELCQKDELSTLEMTLKKGEDEKGKNR